jgi:DNA-binding transcriptional MerR regulator
MFSIGEFARLGAVSIRALRHYDEIGLLPPAEVDPVTGYRSYSAKQLRQLNRIVAPKDLGLTLGVEARLRHIAQEDDMPADDIVVKQVPPLAWSRSPTRHRGGGRRTSCPR